MIDRLRDLDAETFRREYVARGRPVVIEGAAAEWPALSRWTADHFRDRAGYLQVGVRRTSLEQAEISSTTLGNLDADRGEMRLAEFIDRCKSSDGAEELYVPGISMWRLPAFHGDWTLPPVLEGLHKRGSTVWLGRNTRSIGHYHPAQQAMLTQIDGVKEVTLYSPADLGRLSMFPAWSASFYRSRINFHSPESRAKFPQLAKAEAHTCTLRPGDMLFIPVHWLHVPVGVDWSVSLTFWWKARLREWSFPGPGLTCLFWNGLQRTAEAIAKVRHGAGLLPANAAVHRFWNLIREGAK